MATYLGRHTSIVRAANGDIRDAKPVTVYQTGTLTKASLYRGRDSSADAAADNPAITDANGRLSFFVAPGTYDLTFNDGSTIAGVQVGLDAVEASAMADVLPSGGALNLEGAAATTDVITTDVTDDTQKRLIIDADGKHLWGSGSATGDTNLYRSTANVLKTDDSLIVDIDATVNGDLTLGDDMTLASGSVLTWATDTNIYRSAADILSTDDDFRIATAGKGLRVAEGSNAKMGTATLVAGEATVATTAVTANSRVLLTVQSLGTVAAPKAIAITARTAATSFTITSADNTDTSVVAWLLVEPA